MCELFAVSSDHPVKLTYQLTEFATHGGRRYRNRDGWGIVFAQPRDAYLFKEPAEGATSALENLVGTDPPMSNMVMAHVRRATAGAPALCNTHPFLRTIGGQTHSFAHNGDLPELRKRYTGSAILGDCVGDTDSELAFMILLDRLKQLNKTDATSARFELFTEFCREMRDFGDCNFLYGQGARLFVHADQRRYEEADGSLTQPREPGLHICEIEPEKRSWHVRGAHIEKDQAGPQILVASVPLAEGHWTGLLRGTTLWLEQGREMMRA